MSKIRGRTGQVARTAPLMRGGAQVTERRLRNGLRVLIAERHADPVVAVMTFYRVGSRDEPEDLAGVSHLLEHMMFKGAQRFGRGEVDRLTTELGGSNNAFTGTDHTGYWFEFASDRWERALEIEADRMRGLSLDVDDFTSEREVVLEELAMGEDDPWRVLGRRVEAALFQRHPYGRPIIGFSDTLRAMTPARVRAFYDRYYRPENATVVLCGDLQPEPAFRAVRKAFGSLPRGAELEAGDWCAPVQGPEGRHEITMSWDDSAQRLCMAWATAPVGSPEDYALDIAATVLASGRGSRLYRGLVLAGLASSVSAHNDTRVDGGAFWLFVEVANDATFDAVEQVIDDELRQLGTKNITAAELRRALALLVASEAYSGESVSEVAEQLGEFAVDADWRLALDGCENQKRVRPRELRDVVARLLVEGHCVVGRCRPDVDEGRA